MDYHVACPNASDRANSLQPQRCPAALVRGYPQEALTNVAKHAQATHVQVAIEERPTEIAVSTRDDGRGFLPQDPRKAGSFGLVGVRERAYLSVATPPS